MEVCIDINKGTKRQVKWTEAKEIAKTMEIFMGNDLESRKNYIRENLHRYIDIENME